MKLLAVLCLSLWASSAIAGFKTGNQLLAECEGTVGGAIDLGICLGYLTSVIDTAETLVARQVTPRQFCMAEGVTGGQLEKVAIKYLKEHPERLHFSGSSLALDAFEIAFPCPK